MKERQTLKLALEALERGETELRWKAITAIKEALAQPEQEPVAVKRMKEWVDGLKRQSDYGTHMNIPSGISAGTCWELAIELEQFIKTTPPQRTWVGLTDEEKNNVAWSCGAMSADWLEFAEGIEAKLKEKNTK